MGAVPRDVHEESFHVIDMALLRRDPEAFRKSLRGKRYDPELLHQVVELYKESRRLQQEIEVLRREHKKLSQQIAEM